MRMALGAAPKTVRSEVVAEAGLLAILGVGLGLALAYGFSRVLSSVLFELPALDAPTVLGVVGLLTVATLAAAWFPARRATRVDPVSALRLE